MKAKKQSRMASTQMFFMMAVNSPVVIGTALMTAYFANKFGRAWTAWFELRGRLLLLLSGPNFA